MKIFKSKSGFTLIELLVVIGILAVLAAIAIPSVAGLIDRANVSADNTNANEMTNAMERFVSEYELYRQDIASGLIKDADGNGTPDNLDAAQSRVYNVTGAVTIDDIRALESEEGLNGIRIDIDSKYAQNSATAKEVMQNYMKTSSSTFEPKQSDMTYWYNRITGETIVAEKYNSTAFLYQKISTTIDNPKSEKISVSEWIDLSSSVCIPDISITELVDGGKQAGKNIVYLNFTFGDDIDLSKVYAICIPKAKSDFVNLENATTILKVSDQFNKDNMVSEDGYYTISWTLGIPDANINDYLVARLVYEYNEDGRTNYAYSSPITFSYAEVEKAE